MLLYGIVCHRGNSNSTLGRNLFEIQHVFKCHLMRTLKDTSFIFDLLKMILDLKECQVKQFMPRHTGISM